MVKRAVVSILLVAVGAFFGYSIGLRQNELSKQKKNPYQELKTRVEVLESDVQNLKKDLKLARTFPQRPPAPPSEDFSKVYNIESGHSYIKGPENAPVTIVEVLDLQCPYCAHFHPELMETLKSYPEGKIRYMIKNFPLPFHPQARPAAKAALAAGEQGKYWEMVDKLLEHGRELSEAKFAEIAKELGLNVEKFLKDYKQKDDLWEKYISEDFALCRKIDVRGTPTFFINGRKTQARDAASFKIGIDKILSGAKN